LTTKEIVEMLRERACQAGEPWTGDSPKEDHGHTDCWLHNKSADEIERLRSLITAWADAQDKQVSDGGYDPRNIKWPEADTELRKAVGR
jgi:hypothetical protein